MENALISQAEAEKVLLWVASIQDVRLYTQAEMDEVAAALRGFVELLDGQTEPLHPVSWLTTLERARRALALTEDTP